MLPPDAFEFDGMMVITAVDVTQHEVISRLKNDRNPGVRHRSRDGRGALLAWHQDMAGPDLAAPAVAIHVHREAAMKKWLRRIRGAIGMGLTWAIEPKATKKARVYRGWI